MGLAWWIGLVAGWFVAGFLTGGIISRLGASLAGVNPSTIANRSYRLGYG